MTDDELDELILPQLRSRREQLERNDFHDATQSRTDLADSFNEPEACIEARIGVLASEGKIVESAALPGRWMIAAQGDPGDG
ncbi:MAG TPA: hypothetical protein VGP18_07765 [Solirubrobacteraceae bacterium]|jgi:hypothetical protein|nr:hypothetical protein [Solirubrobacteraceae bacterium]